MPAASRCGAVIFMAAAACGAKRVAVWRLSADRTTLLCEDCFDQTTQDHTTGMELHRDQLPDLHESDHPAARERVVPKVEVRIVLRVVTEQQAELHRNRDERESQEADAHDEKVCPHPP